MIIHPLAQVAIYALILSAVLASKLPGIDNQYAYAIYLTSGILAWTLFSEVISRCLMLFIEQGNLMKKMAFPRVSLPAIVTGSCLLNHFLLFVAIFAVFTLLGHPLGIARFLERNNPKSWWYHTVGRDNLATVRRPHVVPPSFRCS